MKNPRSFGLAAAVLLSALSWWLVSKPRERDTAGASSTAARAPDLPKTALPDAVAKSATEITTAKKHVAVAASADAPAPDWSKRLEESDDYWAFAESAIGLAKNGDGDARYWLALALNECEFVYSMYFLETLPGKPPRRRTLDEARQRTAQNSFYKADDMNLLEKRCSRLNQAKDAPFGIGNDWMDAAFAVGNPLAQLNVAFNKAVIGTQDPESEKARDARSEARKWVLDATRTSDPDVLLRAGDTAAWLVIKDEGEAKRRRLSWTLAACQRTPDCEGLALWQKFRCNWDSQCQPYETPWDIIRRDAGSDFDEVERRARELNEKIDAGTLEESDI